MGFQEYIDAPCEIRSMENDLLFVGKVRAAKDDSIEVAPRQGEISVRVFVNTAVKINLFLGGDRFISLGGQVFLANEQFWRLFHVEEFQQFERRGYFRVRTKASAMVAPVFEDADYRWEDHAVPMHNINISLSGTLFSCDTYFHVGQMLEIRQLKLTEQLPDFQFQCHVARVIERDDVLRLYGCRFDGLSEKESDRLCQAIFALQGEEIRRRRGDL